MDSQPSRRRLLAHVEVIVVALVGGFTPGAVRLVARLGPTQVPLWTTAASACIFVAVLVGGRAFIRHRRRVEAERREHRELQRRVAELERREADRANVPLVRRIAAMLTHDQSGRASRG